MSFLRRAACTANMCQPLQAPSGTTRPQSGSPKHVSFENVEIRVSDSLKKRKKNPREMKHTLPLKATDARYVESL